MKRLILTFGALLMAVTLSAATLDQVQAKILKKASVEQLQLRQNGDVVILEGHAASLKDKMEAEKIASKELEMGVVNKISVPVVASDDEINVDVASRIRHKAPSSYGFDTVSVNTKEGHVVLTGSVRNAALYDYAQKAAEETPGVRSVDNRIKILPASISDDRLRFSIFRVLRANYPYYFMGAYPQVTILVDYGRVTLMGHVQSNVDKMRMASLIRSIPGVLSVQNQIS
jgi:osmotically-inducible protein OsmY